MSVYFIQSGEGGHIKIGYARIPENRLKQVRCNNPLDCKLLAVEDGDIERERELHRRFHGAWHRGEWFRPSAELLAHIASLPAYVPSKGPNRRFTRCNSKLGEYLTAHRITVKDFSESLAVSTNRVTGWIHGLVKPSALDRARIEQATSGAVCPSDFGERAA